MGCPFKTKTDKIVGTYKGVDIYYLTHPIWRDKYYVICHANRPYSRKYEAEIKKVIDALIEGKKPPSGWDEIIKLIEFLIGAVVSLVVLYFILEGARLWKGK